MKAHDIISNSIVDEEILDEWSITDPGIKKELVKQGYKLLGSGVDQTAFLEPGTGQVLKIFGTQKATSGSGGNRISRDQEMFVAFATYCLLNSNNPFLPKFSGFERFVYNNHTYFQIRQEKLTPITRNAYCLEVMTDYISDSYSLTPATILKSFQTDEEETYRDVLRFVGKQNIELLLVTCLELSSIATKHNWVFDLHDQNFMQRGKNQIVIVDPWVVRQSESDYARTY